MKTLQQIYEQIRAHLIAQGQPAMRPDDDPDDDSPRCVYYEPTTGLRCAVGALLDPSIDTSPFEGMGIGHLSHNLFYTHKPLPEASASLKAALDASSIPATRECYEFLEAAQHIHDEEFQSVKWVTMKLDELAEEYSLKTH